MRYHQFIRKHSFEYEEEVYKPLDDSDDVVTQVLITLNLKQFPDGIPLDMLQKLITSATDKLTSFKIHNSPEGLTITGQF